MSTNKLYVGNIPFQMTEEELKDLFSSIGKVSEVHVVIDRETNHSRGFGFVTMAAVSDADKALKALNGRDIAGRKILVSEARERGSYAKAKEAL